MKPRKMWLCRIKSHLLTKTKGCDHPTCGWVEVVPVPTPPIPFFDKEDDDV